MTLSELDQLFGQHKTGRCGFQPFPYLLTKSSSQGPSMSIPVISAFSFTMLQTVDHYFVVVFFLLFNLRGIDCCHHRPWPAYITRPVVSFRKTISRYPSTSALENYLQLPWRLIARWFYALQSSSLSKPRSLIPKPHLATTITNQLHIFFYTMYNMVSGIVSTCNMSVTEGFKSDWFLQYFRGYLQNKLLSMHL